MCACVRAHVFINTMIRRSTGKARMKDVETSQNESWGSSPGEARMNQRAIHLIDTYMHAYSYILHTFEI